MNVPTRDRRLAFESEALPHLKNLYKVAARLSPSSTEAADAVQETFLIAWRSFDAYEEGTNCKAWLFQILFNVVRHQRRDWFKCLTGKHGDVADQDLAAPLPIPVELTDRDILSALDRLPRQYPEVLLLVDVEELSYKEASAALRVPIGTVMSRLSRARARLRKELAGMAGSYGLPVQSN
jgi:RNA polymerase sigma-70 factor, ECF subfamily